MSHAQPPSLRSLCAVFARYGNLTFGGGSPTIAVLQQEIVEKRGWMDNLRFGLCYALSRLTPGTNLLAFCTAAGFLLRGWAGAGAVLIAASAPCSAVALAATYVFESWTRNPIVSVASRGALAAAIGVMFVSSWQLARSDIRKGSWLSAVSIAAGCFVLAYFFSVPPLRVIVLAGAIGWLRPARAAE